MVNGAGIFHAKFAGHAGTLRAAGKIVNRKNQGRRI